MKELWKEVEFAPKYSVSSFGRIRGPRGEDLCVAKTGQIKISGKTCWFHRLVARAFIPNPENKPNVWHIDGNKKNNRVENLCWSNNNEFAKKRKDNSANFRKIAQFSLSGEFIRNWDSQKEAVENGAATSSPGLVGCLNGTYKSHAKSIWKYLDSEDLPGEIWKKIEYKENTLNISSHGRVERVFGKKVFGSLQSNGYRNIKIGNTGKFTHERVHRLIAMAFCDGRTKDKDFVNHKDGNRQNNHFSNLEWVTPAENAQHAVSMGFTKKHKGMVM